MSLVWQTIRVCLIWSIFHKKDEDVQYLIQNCSSSQSGLVRNIVGRKWLPVLKKYNVEMPLECPMHLNRDIYKIKRNSRVEYRINQWYCKICGKTFLTEYQIDVHFDTKHSKLLALSEQSTCLANYCNILRCDAEKHQVTKRKETNKFITDVEVWSNSNTLKKYNDVKNPLRMKQPKSASALTSKELAYKKIYQINKGNFKNDKRVPSTMFEKKGDKVNSSVLETKETYETNLKKECIPQQLKALKKQCEEILKICLGDLLIQMSANDFLSLHEEIYRVSCWYLRCDKYWDDSSSIHPSIPFGLVFVLVIVLSTGGCFCYYIIWILFENEPSNTLLTDMSKVIQLDLREIKNFRKEDGNLSQNEGDLNNPSESDFNDHYIYISYPIDTNRKHLTSYYSRTTHL